MNLSRNWVYLLLLAGSTLPALAENYAGPPQALTVSENALSFCYQIGRSAPPLQAFVVSTTGQPVTFSTSHSDPWLQVNPGVGITPAAVAVGIDTNRIGEGTYSSYITVTAAEAGLTPVGISVTVSAGKLPCVTASPSTLRFVYRVGAATPEPRCVSVTSTDPGLSFSAPIPSSPWFTVTPTVGTLPARVCAVPTPLAMSPGEFRGEISIVSPVAGFATLSVPITLTVLPPSQVVAPKLRLYPGTVYFDYKIGSAPPPPQMINFSSDTVPTSMNVPPIRTSWYALTPASASTPGSMAVLANPTDLKPGTYTDDIWLTCPDLTADFWPRLRIVLTVRPGPAASLVAGPGLMAFNWQSGTKAPPSQTMAVRTIPESSVPFMAASSVSWLRVRSSTGMTAGALDVSVNPVGLPAGFYTGTITVASAEAADSPRTILATLTVTNGDGPARLAFDPPAFTMTFDAASGTVTSQNLAISSFSSMPLGFQVVPGGGSWLSVGQRTGLTPATIPVFFDTRNMRPGTYNGTITVRSNDAVNAETTIPVTLRVVTDEPVVTTVVNAASKLDGPVAPGEIVVISGSRLGPDSPVTALPTPEGFLPAEIGGTKVSFDGTLAPVLSAERDKLTVMVPFRVDGTTATEIVVESRGKKSRALRLPVAAVAPGLYAVDQSGAGQADALNDFDSDGDGFDADADDADDNDAGPNGPASPARARAMLVLRATGLGSLNPPPADMRVASDPSAPAASIGVLLNGVPVQVLSVTTIAGSAPGMLQIKIRVPDGISGPEVPLALRAGAVLTQQNITVAVK